MPLIALLITARSMPSVNAMRQVLASSAESNPMNLGPRPPR